MLNQAKPFRRRPYTLSPDAPPLWHALAMLDAGDREPAMTALESVLQGSGDPVERAIAHYSRGIVAARDPALMEELARREVVLEICPTSNLRTGALRDEGQLAEVVATLQDAGVPLVIATDGPEMIGTRLRTEHELLVACGALTVEQAREADARAHRVSVLART